MTHPSRHIMSNKPKTDRFIDAVSVFIAEEPMSARNNDPLIMNTPPVKICFDQYKLLPPYANT
jgi:hypothetical protein